MDITTANNLKLPYPAHEGAVLRLPFTPEPPRVMDASGDVFALVLHRRDGVGSGNPDEALYRIDRPIGRGRNFLTASLS